MQCVRCCHQVLPGLEENLEGFLVCVGVGWGAGVVVMLRRLLRDEPAWWLREGHSWHRAHLGKGQEVWSTGVFGVMQGLLLRVCMVGSVGAGPGVLIQPWHALGTIFRVDTSTPATVLPVPSPFPRPLMLKAHSTFHFVNSILAL